VRPLIFTANGDRIYSRASSGDPYLEGIYPAQNWRYVKQRSNLADLFTFDVENPCFEDGSRWNPSGRDEVLIYRSEDDFDNDERWFGGVLTSIKDPNEFTKNGFHARYSLEATSFNILLDRELRQPQLANLTWEDLVKTLLTRHYAGLLSADFSFISNPLEAPPVKIVNGTFQNLLNAMRTLTSHDYRVDAYKRLHVFQATDNPAPFTVTDSPEGGGMTSFSRQPVITQDARAVFNIVRQPFQELIEKSAWAGEAFVATGDPKSGQIPLLRTPESIEEAVFLSDKFDGNEIDDTLWFEIDTNTTQHPDYPNKGYLFAANGQLQILGGTGALGGVGLRSADFYQYRENSYIVMEFQLTNILGSGYIGLFTDGQGIGENNFIGGLKVVDNQLLALDDTVLVEALGTTTNYILWITQTADGFQYDIHGGQFPTKRTIRMETGVEHLADYKLMPVASETLKGSINSFRYRENERNIVITIDDAVKTIGLESSDTDLPDIDAFLNLDEAPAVIKFKGASFLAVIESVSSDTVFTVAAGQGDEFTAGRRILAGENIVGDFQGKEGFVASVNGDEITLVAPGITGLAPGYQVMVGTTLPAKDTRIKVLYSFLRENEAVSTDPDSIEKYGSIPITLTPKDHIRKLTDAEAVSAANLERFKDGILKISFPSNSLLIQEPDTLSSAEVKLLKRTSPIQKSLIIQRVVIQGGDKLIDNYELELESADPVSPFEDRILQRNLVIGQDGTLRFTMGLQDKAVANDAELVIEDITDEGLYILWSNPNNRKYGEFKWKTV
jgi:hypothetical protein